MNIGRATQIFFLILAVGMLIGYKYSWRQTPIVDIKNDMFKIVQIQAAVKSYMTDNGTFTITDAKIDPAPLFQSGIITTNTLYSAIAFDNWQLVNCAEDGNYFKLSDKSELSHVCLYMQMPAYYACLMEKNFDDGRLDSGLGRIDINNQNIATVPMVYNDCMKTSSKKGGYFLNIY